LEISQIKRHIWKFFRKKGIYTEIFQKRCKHGIFSEKMAYIWTFFREKGIYVENFQNKMHIYGIFSARKTYIA